ncbi:MAG: right-handed parallel beta-helix repeat-containing protein [Bacteroidota bacterium]|nr:right-handed parallel beta-helix repeat-containing protein [Bacteroidota bacterium]
MKRILLVLIAILFPSLSWAATGEFLVYQTSGSYQLTLTLQSSDYAWKLDPNTKQVIVVPTFQPPNFYGGSFGFDSPDDSDDGTNGVMPWGLIHFNLSSNGGGSISFNIDFRDQHWEHGYTGGADIYLYFNPTNGATYLHPPSGSNTPVSNGSTIDIWEAYHQNISPLTTNFLPPVYLQNIINGANAGGYLRVNSVSYSSGNAAPVNYNNTCTIGTKADGANIDRFGPGMTYKHNNWNNAPSDYLLSRNVYVTSQNTQQYAYFPSLNSATLQNSLDGTIYTDANGGYIPFVDPWYVDANGNQTGQPVNITSGSSPTGAYEQTGGGVFLGQQIISGQPYYSLQAPVSQTINGHSASFFGGWSVSPSGYVAFQNAASPTTAVVFSSAGATITANYIYSVVTTNATLQAGTYTFAGNLTVNAGVTLTLSSGTILQFPSGATLIVNGSVVGNGATLTQSTSNGWTGVVMNQDGSSLTNCVISYAISPVSITNINSAIVSGCTINNSDFSSTQAILVSNSSPVIFGTSINGQSGSWNGVRFTSGSHGTLRVCTIQNCGIGNGIVIQGGSNPTIDENTISSNHYHGIIVISNGSGNPTITNNTLQSNGVVNGTRTYCGIDVNGSTALIQYNDIHDSNYGVYAENTSSPTSGGLGQDGKNVITNNNIGVIAYSYSTAGFGSGNPPRNQYWGVCNSFYDNANYDAYASNHSTVSADFSWWGQFPPNSSKFYADGTSYVSYNYPATYNGDCPLGGYIASPTTILQGKSGSLGPAPVSDPAALFQLAQAARLSGDFKTGVSICRTILKDSAAAAYSERVLVLLYNLFQASGDTSISNDFTSYSASSDPTGILASELLASTYAGAGRLTEAEAAAEKLKADHPGTGIEKRALLTLASLTAFDQSYSDKSNAALNELVQKFGSTMDKGTIVALTTTNSSDAISEPLRKFSNIVAADTVQVLLGNYPNPFNPATTIRFTIQASGFTTLKVYDILGRDVATLVDEVLQVGPHSVAFDASRLSSGIYFYTLRGTGINETRKMLVEK